MSCGLFQRTCDLRVQSVLPHDIYIPKNHCAIKDYTMKSIGLIGKMVGRGIVLKTLVSDTLKNKNLEKTIV